MLLISHTRLIHTSNSCSGTAVNIVFPLVRHKRERHVMAGIFRSLFLLFLLTMTLSTRVKVYPREPRSHFCTFLKACQEAKKSKIAPCMTFVLRVHSSRHIFQRIRNNEIKRELKINIF